MSPSQSESFDLGSGWRPFPGWSLVTVRGRDGERFLHSQLTNDIAALKTHQSCLTALLDRTGRIQAFCFVLREEQTFRMLIPSELLELTLERLNCNLVADDVEFATEEAGAMALVLGPTAAELAASFDREEIFPLEIYAQIGFVTWSSKTIDLPQLTAKDVASRRLLSGFPRWGLDVNPGQLINETTLVDTAVAHHKGCYLGQETVHKISTRRGAAYAPMALHVEGNLSNPEAFVGRTFSIDGNPGGKVLDWAIWENHLYFEARTHRDFRVDGLEVSCLFDDGHSLGARIRRLPLITAPAPRRLAEEIVRYAAKLFTSDRELEAETWLERAIAVCPKLPDAYEALGVALGRRGAYEQAIVQMNRLLEVDPASVMAHANLSVYFNRLGRIEDAERELALAREAQTESAPPAEVNIGGANNDLRDSTQELDRREAMFEQVLAVDPDDVLALFSLGELRSNQGRHQEAIEFFARAIDIQPGHAQAYLRLAEAWEGIGDITRAISVYEAGVNAAAKAGTHDTADTMQSRLATLRNRA